MQEARLEWADVPAEQLNIPLTLTSGQSFRWRRGRSGDWLGVIDDLLVCLRPAESGFGWQTWPESGRWDAVARYFGLEIDLEAAYTDWTRRDPRIRPALERYAGLRILRQPPEEAFLAFQCAACNTVPKITRSIRALEQQYGERVGEVDGEPFYRFPAPARVAGADEKWLRETLWGYRAPRLIAMARFLTANPGWLERLAQVPYRDAHGALASLFGIGPKLADCICLFGLGHDEAVPVDTHIRKAAVRWYRQDLRTRSMTPGVYRALGDAVRERFGPLAGWAQQYLFMQEFERTRTRDASEPAKIDGPRSR